MIMIKTIKNGITVGTEVPIKQKNGNVGRWAEKELSQKGHAVTNEKGVDMPIEGIEIKTRKIESSSPHSVGSMRVQDIVDTPYSISVIREKLQTQYRIGYSDEGQVVTKEGLYDWSDDYVQDRLCEAYEDGRKQIAADAVNGFHPPYIKGNSWGYWEQTGPYGSYTFRIPNGAMTKLEKIAENKSLFDKLFDK
jgi:hypothetical protein